MNEALVKQVFADEEFVKSLFQLETPQEVQSTLKEKGIELSIDDIVKVKDYIAKKFESGEELTDDELAGVTGGSARLLIYVVAACGAALGGMSMLGIAGTITGTLLGTKW